MARVDELAVLLFKWEGGYANHKDDHGGPTNMGVTIATYREYCRRHGKPEPGVGELKAIGRDTVIDILRTMYWNPCKGDRIANQSIANLVVGGCWGSGLGYIRVVQGVLGVMADGIVGERTLAAINGQPQQELFRRLWERRRKYFLDIVERDPSQRVFLKGWLNRLNDYTFRP